MLTEQQKELWKAVYEELDDLNLLESDLFELLIKLGMPEPKVDVEFTVDLTIQMRVEIADLPHKYDEDAVVDGIRESIVAEFQSAVGCFGIDVNDETYDGDVRNINVDVDDVSLY